MVALLNPPKGVEVHHYRTDAEWRDGPRKRDMTASRAAVLFDGRWLGAEYPKIRGLEHPYATCQDVASVVCEPSRRKTHKQNAYMLAGEDQEPAIIHRLWREHPELQVRDLHGRGERVYLREPSVRLGATLEPCVCLDEAGDLWVCEFKSASYREYHSKGWATGVPGWVWVQGNTAAGLAGAKGCIFMCVQRDGFGIGEAAYHKVEFDGRLFEQVRIRAAVFARRVRDVRFRLADAAARKGVIR